MRNNKTALNLTALETSVLAALRANASDLPGGDFALLEELDAKPLGITRYALGGVVTSLENKKVISVDITYVNGDRRNRVTQVEFLKNTLT